MIPIFDATPSKMVAKVKDCLRWSQIRSNNRPWLPKTDLTMEYLQRLLKRQGYRCALTGLPLTLSGPQSGTLDRINGKRGYRRRNVRWVAKFANSAKSSMTDDDFMVWWRALPRQMRRARLED